jgi:alpha-L-fucosidase
MTDLYLPTLTSLQEHQVPDWFQHAKFGIMISWGLYSIPGWAVPAGPLPEVIKKKGYRYLYRNNPYAEFYWNSLKLTGSPTAEFHKRQYGNDFDYPQFLPEFTRHIDECDPAYWADKIKAWQARYVVLVAKHHDGYLLWPSRTPNPYRPDFMSKRDIVGELTTAVRARGMQMGLYYSGGPDWWFEGHTIESEVDFATNIPQSTAYVDYVNHHWRELIDRYQPSILWNDIGFPAALDVNQLYADYYNQVPDGVINDRSIQADVRSLAKNPVGRLLIRLGTRMAMKSLSSGQPMKGVHADFRTPEYSTVNLLTGVKWEATRGLGYSFGYNQNETADHMLSVTQLIHLLVDIVSKNGNLLLCVGPKADGSIPDLQRERLDGLGHWLGVNGEAIFKTRPWVMAEMTTTTGLPIRFTAKNDCLYLILLGSFPEGGIQLSRMKFPPQAELNLLGSRSKVDFRLNGENVVITMQDPPPSSPAHVLRITPYPEVIT